MCGGLAEMKGGVSSRAIMLFSPMMQASSLIVLYLVVLDASLATALASAFVTTMNHQPTPPHNPTIPELIYITSESLHNTIAAYPSLAISDSNLPGLPEQRSQDQQIQAALPLGGTVRDTKWRVREERGPAFIGGGVKKKSKDTMYCTSTVIFRGVAGDSNRGTVEYDPGTCQKIDLDLVDADENSDVFAKSKGLRWVSKTTRVIQLTARWKVKLPEGRYIYKGYIDGGRRRQIEGMSGQNKLEMTGTILTGDDDTTNRVVGKFTADLIEREI